MVSKNVAMCLESFSTAPVANVLSRTAMHHSHSIEVYRRNLLKNIQQIQGSTPTDRP